MAQILVIEDEISIRNNIAETLEFNNHVVRTADCGTHGLDMAYNYQPDLIICDIMMDDLDGYAVLKGVRTNTQTATTPFIFVTAKADRNSMRAGMELGADDYLTKPFTTHELLTAVESRLDRHQLISAASGVRLDQVREKLNTMISRELQEPLESVNMIVDVISRQIGHLSREEVDDLLETISMGTRRMNRTVNQMVFLTRLASGELTPEVVANTGRPMRLWEILVTAIDMAHHFGYKRRDVLVNFEDYDRGTRINCRPSALKQALAELILNALLYSPIDGMVTIAQWEADGSLWIMVEDHGPGMSIERLHAAQTNLYARETDNGTYEDVGIGLSLAKGIIEAHNGALEIQTARDEGTRSLVRLPVYAG